MVKKITTYSLRQATAEVTRLRKRVAELGDDYFDIKFVKHILSIAENNVRFLKSRIAEQTPTPIEKWLTK